MPVLINEFEAVAEPPAETRAEGGGQKPARRITPAELRPALSTIALRAARLRAH